MPRIEVDVSDAVEKVREAKQNILQAGEEWKGDVMEKGVKYLIRYMPVDTGALVDSIEIEEAGGRLGFVIAVTADHAIYVDQKTRPSPGKYSPFLVSKKPEKKNWPGARYVNPPKGMHPGTKAVNFRKKAREDMRKEFPRIYRKKLYKLMT